MARQSIFIGSASESKELASAIAKALADAGHRPLRWWLEFPPGSITIDRLMEIAASADGAAFLLTSTDRTWYRQEVSGSPRDNVILEYGLFVARNGRQRTLILTEQGTKLPSDILGITSEKILEDAQTVAERTVEHFNRQFSDPLPPPLEAIRLIVDPIVLDQQISDPLPASWYQRDLYFGIEGAKNWLATVDEQSYVPRKQELELRHKQIAAVESIVVRTFVSFGPGDADADKEIAICLRNKEPWLQYIPVDISDGLIHRAVKTLGDQVRVPLGILGDFEDGLHFVARKIRDHGVRPILFSLLGNTLGNLDRHERRFLDTVGSTIMASGDYLLLDVSVAGPQWSRDVDRRCQHSSYGRGHRRFIATGVARRTGESVESIALKFEERIKFEHRGRSDIPNTRSIDFVDAKSGRTISTIRRYDWDSLLKWFESRGQFQIVFKDHLADEIIGDGVVLLKKK
jgi:hypothetical protein